MGRRKNILLLGMDDAFAYWRYRAAFGAGLSYAGPTREERTSQGKPRRTRRRRV